MPPWRILIVDDEPEIREVISEYLEALGNHVDAFARGRQAIEQVGQEILPYDVAIVDWTMPGISGRDVVQAIQKGSPTTRIIVATGQLDLNAASGLNLQEMAVLRKPFTLRSLSGTLSEVMEGGPARGSSP